MHQEKSKTNKHPAFLNIIFTILVANEKLSYLKKSGNIMTHDQRKKERQKEKKSIETDTDVTQVIKLIGQEFKTIFTYMNIYISY